jgi:hypothetical protein
MDERIFEEISKVEDSFYCLSLDELNSIAYPGFLGHVKNRVLDISKVFSSSGCLLRESYTVRSAAAKLFLAYEINSDS